MKHNYSWPNGAKFAFSVFDDTDNATIENCKPVYDYLIKKGVLTTKSVWVYAPRGGYSGGFLKDNSYLEWIKDLKSNGVEIGLHNIGDGAFITSEIEEGLETFNKLIGYYPKVHANHAANPDNLYSWEKRFVFPVNLAYKLYRYFYFLKRKKWINLSNGENLNSSHFWGNIAKDKIKYVRNYTFTDINTLKLDNKMPWHDRSKPFVNYWFSSSDGSNLKGFNNLLSSKNLDQLENEGGACIVYTHFASGFVDKYGNLDPVFKQRIDDLASRKGWFVPTGVLLDFILSQRKLSVKNEISYMYKLEKSLFWAFERIKRYLGLGI